MGRKKRDEYFKDMHQQMHDKLVSMQAFGKDKSDMVGTNWQKISSVNIYKTYWEHIKYFITWMKKYHPEITTMKKARKYVNEWLQSRVDEELSIWEIRTEARALGKLYDISPDDPDYFHLGENEIGIINLHPTICNICAGKVIFTSNSKIYGREYGSGKMYYCTKCHAFVGTHISYPNEAFGILANKEMREAKKKCHTLFDEKWCRKDSIAEQREARNEAYEELSKKLGIPTEDCHFGFFDMDMLQKAYDILLNE